MGFFSGLLIGAAGGATLAWVFLPEPKWMRDFYIRIGLAKPTTPVVPFSGGL